MRQGGVRTGARAGMCRGRGRCKGTVGRGRCKGTVGQGRCKGKVGQGRCKGKLERLTAALYSLDVLVDEDSGDEDDGDLADAALDERGAAAARARCKRRLAVAHRGLCKRVTFTWLPTPVNGSSHRDAMLYYWTGHDNCEGTAETCNEDAWRGPHSAASG
eukprot:364953-Chlamydomonas_euryale.AAC.11